ncbi:hypothetical protein POSPLADRAFT_1045243 [Postia placenta MAD-698-R-SB12]|uniref:Protein HGH1 homolog n=1 Tax=Postia placenta MAD-698-R-SB12 TaxID=670580 RepID=A0A1X6N6U9_9APHY|nr:hypothetical protein POSPLADRAFT_1045243 [Postia placenta MAD-698-R-SB12]OSX64123.1 hypothetical protein POSPLADRAFT_1045243 [Postia placenta MAD-698-R-SB12]
MSADQLKELLPFLHDPNPQVRQIALSNLLGQTPKGSPHREIFFTGLRAGGLQQAQDNEVIHDLKLLCRDTLVRTLLDLAQGNDPKSLTLYFPVQSQSGTSPAPVPYPSAEPRSVEALPLLLDAFIQGAAADEIEDKDKRPRKANLHFLSSVFANLTTAPVGRMFFLTPRTSDPLKADGDLEYPLTKLLVFTEHKDTIRRGGVASTLKNCAFYVQSHRALLLPESERVAVSPSTVEASGMEILPYLLLPLAGPEEFDLEDQELLPPALQFLPPTKRRESDPVLRLTHVETLLLLCTTRWAREYLRKNGVYEIVRALHENEQVDKISEHIERLVNFLKRDEGPETEADDVLGATETIEAIQMEDPVDEDSRIEEI